MDCSVVSPSILTDAKYCFQMALLPGGLRLVSVVLSFCGSARKKDGSFARRPLLQLLLLIPHRVLE